MRRVLFPLLAAALVVGCGGRPTDTSSESDGGVALTPITVADLDKAIASHKGKVVVIDCWFLG